MRLCGVSLRRGARGQAGCRGDRDEGACGDTLRVWAEPWLHAESHRDWACGQEERRVVGGDGGGRGGLRVEAGQGVGKEETGGKGAGERRILKALRDV